MRDSLFFAQGIVDIRDSRYSRLGLVSIRKPI